MVLAHVLSLCEVVEEKLHLTLVEEIAIGIVLKTELLQVGQIYDEGVAANLEQVDEL